MNSKEIFDINKEYTFFLWSNQGQANPIPIVKSEGIYFWDPDGKRYLDFASQLANENIGHQHPNEVKTIQDQAAVLNFVAPGMATEPRGLLGKKQYRITCYFGLSLPILIAGQTLKLIRKRAKRAKFYCFSWSFSLFAVKNCEFGALIKTYPPESAGERFCKRRSRQNPASQVNTDARRFLDFQRPNSKLNDSASFICAE